MPESAMALEYTERGQGPPLILIMGLNADASAWSPHVDAWMRSFRCFAVDNRGAGRSPAPPGPYKTPDLADDYAALIRHLGIGPTPVVGISMGGAIAQELALRHPDLVDRLVLVATWARCDPYTDAVLEGIAAVRRFGDPAAFTAHLQTLVWTPAWFDEHAGDLAEQRLLPLPVAADALAAQVSACRTHDALGRVGRIGVPTLVTAGGVDRFVPSELSRLVAEVIPGATFELFADTGHVHHWEELDRFNNLIEGWLRA